MKKYDAAIIGSGLGGLLCGYILSKEGYKVCVLEKNGSIGGCLQTFKFDGCSFNSCAYYFGGYDKGQNLWRYFKYFGLTDKLNADRMDKNGFDRISFMNNEKEYNIAMGYDNFVDTLAKEFPSEKYALEKYARRIKETCKDFPLYNLNSAPDNLLKKKNIHDSTREFIDSLTKDVKLRGVLAGENLIYAGVAGETPLYVHALIMDSFIQSAWRFRGGSAQLADILSSSIKESGGEIFTNCEVVSIKVNRDKAVSAALRDSGAVEADRFISDIHPGLTIGMLEGSNTGRLYKERILSLENTSSAFMLYITLKKDKVRPIGHNYYYYADENVWDTVNYRGNNWPQSCLIRFPPPENGNNYVESLNVVSYMKYEEVKQWAGAKSGERGAGYCDFKAGKAESLISFIEKKWPGFKDNIKSFTVSTPLTLRDCTGTIDGAMYGLLKSCVNPARSLVPPRTKISNLYLTGQNITLHGLLGVTIASVSACSELLGYEYLINKIKNA